MRFCLCVLTTLYTGNVQAQGVRDVSASPSASSNEIEQGNDSEGEGGAGQTTIQTRFEDDVSKELSLEVGQTRLVHISKKIIRVSVAEPDVADLQVVTKKQMLITAKAVGYTHLIVWSEDDNPVVLAVSVTRNLDQLRKQFVELFPKEDIQISAVGDLLVLSGTVSDLRIPARAAEVASLHTDRLANLIQVVGDQQVQLDVRFAEVSRTGMRKTGVNFLWGDSQEGYVGGQASSGTSPGQYLRGDGAIPGTGDARIPLVPGPVHGDAFNLFFSSGLKGYPFSAILSIMVQEGLAKVLAEPSLTALSGQDAEFHAGGEVPIIVSEELGRVRMEYKKYGVLLKFTPTVLGEKAMSLKLEVEVSEPDTNAGIVASGFQVPGFKTRRSETTIRLADGQSFAIAGLLSDSSRHWVSKVPILGDIPILGALFRSSAYQREETELLMVVTGHLVHPVQKEKFPSLPGEDEFNDPSDFRLFLLGSIKPKKVKKENRRNDARATSARPALETGNYQKRTNTKSSAPERKLAEGPLGPVGFIRN
ncbi:MAG: type II and III secretion system protein family protein [Deltaproteobacteria bacterium]|nr:type II and III secretion system protein family protein [Deltaproteobacteria bacterium]